MMQNDRWNGIRVVAFDADDTLWDCQSWFDEVERKCCDLLAPWATAREVSEGLFATERKNLPLTGYGTKAFTLSLIENAVRIISKSGGEAALVNGKTVDHCGDGGDGVNGKTVDHCGDGGDGVNGKTVDHCGGGGDGVNGKTVDHCGDGLRVDEVVLRLIALGQELLTFPTTPLPEVQETLERLSQSRRYQLVVFTKGELLDQENKLKRSGLERYFSYMETVSNKTEIEYRRLCENLGVAPEETVMVGNSFRSDIAPALETGAYALHIPFHVVWELEKSEEYPHERLRKISHFGEVLDLLG